jgi:hypothetical protein
LSYNKLTGQLSDLSGLQYLPLSNGTALAHNQFLCPLPSWASEATPCARSQLYNILQWSAVGLTAVLFVVTISSVTVFCIRKRRAKRDEEAALIQ